MRKARRVAAREESFFKPAITNPTCHQSNATLTSLKFLSTTVTGILVSTRLYLILERGAIYFERLFALADS